MRQSSELQPPDRSQLMGNLVADHWLSRTVLPLLDPDTRMEDAVAAREVFLSRIQPLLGPPVGYKVAAITPPAQRDLKVTEPLGAVYLAGMLKEAGDIDVPLNYAARPIVEAKLLVAVKDDAINAATTIEQAARSIAYLIPSIELGDSLVMESQPITGPILTLHNVGARLVLCGPALPFDGSSSAIDALATMTVTTTDATAGRMLDVQKGQAMMGHPLNAVLWIVGDRRSKRGRLQPGDRLGLGAMSRVRPTKGMSVRTVWEGLTLESVVVDARFS